MSISKSQSRRIRAEWVVPISSDPVQDGEVIVENGQIIEVRKAAKTPGGADDVEDYGSAILMPGLVNVHTHLDYTVMRGILEDISFFPWVRRLVELKGLLDEHDWNDSAMLGAAEAIAAGVTTIGDCTSTGASLFAAKKSGLRGVIYQEVFGIDPAIDDDAVMHELTIQISAMRWVAAGSKLKIGISPHSPYTVRQSLLTKLALYTSEESLPICMHTSESRAESELLLEGRGEIREMFNRRGIQWDCPQCSTVEYFSRHGLLSPHTLLVHGCQLGADDLPILKKSGVGWAHCPKSNAKLGNGTMPLGLLRGVWQDNQAKIGLGSDSVASNNTMDIFEEMRFALLIQRARARKYDSITTSQVLEMSTSGGARALNMANDIGTLARGKQADITVLKADRLHMIPVYEPAAAIVHAAHGSDVRATYIGGELLYQDGRFRDINTRDINISIERITKKLQQAKVKSSIDATEDVR
jgi:5-methylthioadenosine/S-adenosylhomocysteine deaminase